MKYDQMNVRPWTDPRARTLLGITATGKNQVAVMKRLERLRTAGR